jgi:cysteine synthase
VKPSERKRLLQIYGAELVYTDPMDGSDGAIREARRRYERDPHRYFYPDQYSNPANWRAHYETTGVEIIEQTGGRLTHFVAGLGTGGTFVGTGRRLREWRPTVQLISVEPESALHGRGPPACPRPSCRPSRSNGRQSQRASIDRGGPYARAGSPVTRVFWSAHRLARRSR